MTLYTNGSKPATEDEIISAAAAIQSGRRKSRRGGRKPALSKTARLDALVRVEAGESIPKVAEAFGVSESTIRRIK